MAGARGTSELGVIGGRAGRTQHLTRMLGTWPDVVGPGVGGSPGLGYREAERGPEKWRSWAGSSPTDKAGRHGEMGVRPGCCSASSFGVPAPCVSASGVRLACPHVCRKALWHSGAPQGQHATPEKAFAGWTLGGELNGACHHLSGVAVAPSKNKMSHVERSRAPGELP